jgi:1-acyl-sn-glycerol-3-phosphate acyltransferase
MTAGRWRRIRGVFHTLVFYSLWAVVGLTFTFVLFVPMRLLSRPFPAVLRPLRAFTRGFYGVIVRSLEATGALRMAEMTGVERLRRGGPAVVVANHRTMMDVLILMWLLPDASCLLKPVEKPPEDQRRAAMPDFWKPFILAPFSLLGYVPMPPVWNDREALKNTFDRCRALLREGRPLVIFPEGTRSPDGHLLPFRDFPFHLAKDAGVPIIPVVIHTDTRFMPQGTVSINAARRCTYRLRVLPDIVPTPRTRSSDLLVEVRQRLQKAVAQQDATYGYLDA